jgi:hypothetical protein
MSDPLAHLRQLARENPAKWAAALTEHERQLSGVADSATTAKLPPLREMIAQFIADAFVHLVHGLPQAPWGLAARRMRICRGCPKFIAQSERCGACGCYLSTKTSWKLSECPEKKW